MFNNFKLQQELKEKDEMIKSLTKKIEDNLEVKKLNDEIKNLQEQLKEEKKTSDNLLKEFEADKRILKRELETEIQKATAKKQEENNELLLKNAVLNEKVSILEKAFENMGFDVKDMKDILNKLVDGVVSKNTVNVIK